MLERMSLDADNSLYLFSSEAVLQEVYGVQLFWKILLNESLLALFHHTVL